MRSVERTRHVPIIFITAGSRRDDWDRASLERVVSNLLGNAVAHGSVSVPVRVLLYGRSEERVLLSLKNGGTIPAALLPTIFDAFKGRRTAEA